MFNHIKSLLVMALCGALFSSCYKDRGNYDYQAINQPVIGFDSSYTGTYGKVLDIVPKLSFSQASEADTYDTSKYSYEWSVVNPAALLADQRSVLATTRDFHATLTAPPASYSAFYRITDKKTGVQWMKNFSLTITTNIYEGWLVLSDVNSISRLDMVSLIGGQYKPVISVLDSVQSGLPQQGKPINVCFSATNTTGIYICTETGTNRINPDNFKWTPQLGIKYEMLSKVDSSFKPSYIMPVNPAGLFTQYMYAQGNVYYYFYVLNILFGTPINTMQGESGTFKAAPFIAGTSSDGVVLYDEGKKRFVRQVWGTTNCVPMPSDKPYFDYTTNKKMVYMAFTRFGNGEVFSILNDEATGKYYLARFNFGSSINQTYYSEIPVADIGQAKNFAINPDYGYVFYNIGSKVYEYDMGSKQSKLMLDKGDKQISSLKFQTFGASKYIAGSASIPVLYNKLIVASYDPAAPAASCGTMELFTVPPINGDLQPFQSFSGFGKIASVTYRER